MNFKTMFTDKLVEGKKLSSKDKKDILKDFYDWSGGAKPVEMDWDSSYGDEDDQTIEEYLGNLDSKYDLRAVTDWFMEIT